MKKLFGLLTILFCMCLPAAATTWNVTTSSNLQSVVNGASAGDTVSFAAGQYTITAPIVLKCGITYTGPIANPATAVLNAPNASTPGNSNGTFELFSNGDLSAPCTQQTLIQYFDFNNMATGIYVRTSFTNLVVAHNQFTRIIGSTNRTAALVFESGNTMSNTASTISNTLISFNQLGDLNSCLSPTNVMADVDSPEDYEGACNGMVFYTSINGLTITNNNFLHVSEGVHINCPGYVPVGGSVGGVIQKFSECEPPGGSLSQNMITEFNDFNQIHRITWEQQPQQTGGMVWDYNSSHDYFNPYFGTYGLSNACCYNGTLFQPNLEVNNNLVLFNTVSTHGRYAYGMEAMGKLSHYDNNLLQSSFSPASAGGLTYGRGPVYSMANNTVQGGWVGDQATYIQTESLGTGAGLDDVPIVFTGNITGPTITSFASAVPSISPGSSARTFPLTVTLTDPGFTSGSLPLGNTGIWYTTDNSNPVPGAGSAKRLDSGGTFVLASAATVKAVGMWGAANQPTSYQSGYGFTPSTVVTATYTGGTGTYFIAPNGSDTNNGTSAATPWLTPNHAVNCGDTITAAAGTYSAGNFNVGDWGTVTCPLSNNVAWLKCATFDTCKITSTNSDAIRIDKSYWGVTGWETSTNTTQSGACFAIVSDVSGVKTHHVVLANNVANGCMGGGFTSYNLNTTTGVDYLAIVGNIAYNGAQGNTHCFSNISIYQPVASDTTAGTHIYIAGNYSYAGVEPATCNGTPSTDGEGIILDTFDGDQGGTPPYTPQAVVQNNINFFNGNMGVEALNNKVGSTFSTIVMKFNTAYGDITDNNQTAGCLGRSELAPRYTRNTTFDHNIGQTRTGTSCSSGAIYGSFVETCDASCVVTNNWIFSAAGNNTGIDASSGFSFGAGNIIGTSPAFANPVNPGAPACTGTANVAACMAAVISDYTPTNATAKTYGYQAVSNTSITDALFPQWLCVNTSTLNSNIPAGLITPGCGSNTVQLVSITVSTGGIGTLTIPNTLPLVAQCGFSDGSSNLCTGSITNWVSSNSAAAPVSAAGLVTATSPGSATFTASIGSVFGVSPSVTIVAGAVTFQFADLYTIPTNVNTMAVGASVTFGVNCHYSDGSVLDCTHTDANGYSFVASSWTSSNTNVLSIGANTGIAVGVAVGTSNVQAQVNNGGTAQSTHIWTFTINQQQITLQTIQIASANGITTFNAGQSAAITALCGYSNGQTLDCTQPDTFGDQATIISSNLNVGTFVNNVFTATTKGNTTISATVGSIPSNPNLLLTVLFNGPLTAQGFVLKGVTMQ